METTESKIADLKKEHVDLKFEEETLKEENKPLIRQLQINRGLYRGEKVSLQEYKTLQTQHESNQKRLEEIKVRKSSLIKEVKDLERSLKQTCPYCLQQHRVVEKTGKMRRHGWKVIGNRRHGQYGSSWHTGRCSGGSYAPLEVSPEGSFAALTDMGEVLSDLRSQRDRFKKERPVLQIDKAFSSEYDKNLLQELVASDDTISIVRENAHERYSYLVTFSLDITDGFEGYTNTSPELPRYETQLTKVLSDLTQQIDWIERDKQTMREAVTQHGWEKELVDFDLGENR